MVGQIVGAARLVSGIFGLLGTSHRRRKEVKAAVARRKAAVATGVPVYGTHYRYTGTAGAPEYPGPRIEMLCPDGEWRRFVWWTNSSNPWIPDKYHGRKSAAEMAYWLADKFVGPTHFAKGEAMSERGVRAAGVVGIWTLDPYCPDACHRARYPYHGKGFPNRDGEVPPDGLWAKRLGEIRLLPCYETCGDWEG